MLRSLLSYERGVVRAGSSIPDTDDEDCQGGVRRGRMNKEEEWGERVRVRVYMSVSPQYLIALGACYKRVLIYLNERPFTLLEPK